ncbi:MAG TPA: hypothetical protein P5550_01995 [Bacteroidales bacterium]|nr:hypothetical protein [Bacteroidales bacterium]HRZ75737.1 hypothetical protein [Bacteroidales bacterium]
MEVDLVFSVLAVCVLRGEDKKSKEWVMGMGRIAILNQGSPIALADHFPIFAAWQTKTFLKRS